LTTYLEAAEMDESAQVLSIGSVVGGSTPTNRRWRDAIRDLTSRVVEARSDVDSPLNVNVVFQVPGNIIKPDFDGTRTGRFSKKDSLLMVQVGLPEEVPEDVEAYLKDAIYAALDEAERWAERRRQPHDLSQLRAILDRV
jgi:hypothetical protein